LQLLGSLTTKAHFSPLPLGTVPKWNVFHQHVDIPQLAQQKFFLPKLTTSKRKPWDKDKLTQANEKRVAASKW
jgi:hypothetical protein